MTFSEFFEAVKNATFGFQEIITAIVDFYNNLFLDFNISQLVSGMRWHLRYVEPAIPFILIILFGVIALTGKRIFGFIRCTAFVIAGFLIGIYTLSPIILEVMPSLPTWVIGAVTGVVAGVLSKILYYVALVAVSGYSTYILCMRGIIPGVATFTEGNWVVGLICAAVVIVAVLILLKYIEMSGTAMLGGYGIACIIRGWYDYTSLTPFVGREWLGVLIVTLIFAVIGFIVQWRTRERYN
ncbi:MAG: hypothetical protein IJW48_03420 [Clostridia bacterium]|nr:hypothetical protein [Clostridia bacterium]